MEDELDDEISLLSAGCFLAFLLTGRVDHVLLGVRCERSDVQSALCRVLSVEGQSFPRGQVEDILLNSIYTRSSNEGGSKVRAFVSLYIGGSISYNGSYLPRSSSTLRGKILCRKRGCVIGQ